MQGSLLGEDLDQEAPALPEEVRRYLGQSLAAAYGREAPEADIADRFADLLAQLESALDSAGHRAAAAFQAALLAAVPALRRFAVSLTHDPVAADDLVQDTMLRAWRGQASFAIGTNLEAWACTIMRNQFYSNYRKHGREVQDEDGVHAAKLPVLPEQGGWLDLQDLRVALGRLAPQIREALVLVAVQNLSYEEAATVMQCQIGTVKSRVWRAREQLARILGYDGAEVGQDSLMLSTMGRVVP